MSDQIWFTPKSVRRITLRSYGVLVGKAPTKQKRMKLLCTMPLTGQQTTGFPDWLADARDYVMQHGQVIKPAESINHVNVTMSDQNLFEKTPIEAPKAKLSHFSIENMGSSEDPTTVLKFQVMVPYSTDLNRWCGTMAGEEFDSTYQVVGGGDVTDSEEEEEAEEESEDVADDPLAAGEDGEEDDLQGQKRRRAARAKGQTTLDQQPTADAVAKAKEAIRLM